MKERRVSHKVFMAWEYDKEEAYYDELSREGWQVEKMGCFHTVLVKDESVTYRHRLDFNPDAMKSEAERQRYIETFADDGWEFINSTFNGWIGLRKAVKPGMTEADFAIYTDRESLMGLVNRFIRMIYFLFFLCLFAFTGNLVCAIGGKSWPNLLCAIVMAGMFVWILCGIRQLKEKQETLAGETR